VDLVAEDLVAEDLAEAVEEVEELPLADAPLLSLGRSAHRYFHT
jgi:hypothetical protein